MSMVSNNLNNPQNSRAVNDQKPVIKSVDFKGFQFKSDFNTPCCECVPLRYNNDKQKKPLFSRGLSVCRLLFNSFSKLKIDENYKEKRRLFY